MKNHSISVTSEGNRDEQVEESSYGQAVAEAEAKTSKPTMYKVVILNDDFTPRDFVVLVLMRYFRKTEQQATVLMLQVHNEGSGIAGVFTYELAETKAYQVNSFSEQQKFPLKCIIEEA